MHMYSCKHSSKQNQSQSGRQSERRIQTASHHVNSNGASNENNKRHWKTTYHRWKRRLLASLTCIHIERKVVGRAGGGGGEGPGGGGGEEGRWLKYSCNFVLKGNRSKDAGDRQTKWWIIIVVLIALLIICITSSKAGEKHLHLLPPKRTTTTPPTTTTKHSQTVLFSEPWKQLILMTYRAKSKQTDTGTNTVKQTKQQQQHKKSSWYSNTVVTGCLLWVLAINEQVKVIH